MNRTEVTRHLHELTHELHINLLLEIVELKQFIHNEFLRLEEVTDLTDDDCKEAIELANKLKQHIERLREDANKHINLPPEFIEQHLYKPHREGN